MQKSSVISLILASLLVMLLALPLLIRIYNPVTKTLYGYTEPIPQKPKNYLASFFTKDFQRWVEKYFNANMGLRTILIRSFNEIHFRLFHGINNIYIKIIATKEHGLYSNLSIASLNNAIAQKTTLEKNYQKYAKQLLQIQHLLAQQGKYFLVVVASSKAYIYPKDLTSKYLSGGSEHVFKRAANFGRILQASGVNVIDSGRILRHLVRTTKFETHPASGLHWNYASACIIAQAILEKASQQFPLIAKLDCGNWQRIKPPLSEVDVDGYLLLNLWTEAGLLRLTTYPTISSVNHTGWHPKIVFIGDSFSDQIRFALRKANIYSQIVMSSYFKTRTLNDTQPVLTNITLARQGVLNDIKLSDIIIVELVDYNITNNAVYDFPRYFLKAYGPLLS